MAVKHWRIRIRVGGRGSRRIVRILIEADPFENDLTTLRGGS
jgi:hypothetical protein